MTARRDLIVHDAIERSRDADPAVRRAALHELCPCQVKADFPEAWDRVLELTGDPDRRVRSAALHNLCDGSPSEYLTDVVRTLEWMSEDPDPKIRRTAKRVLFHHRRTGRVNVL